MHSVCLALLTQQSYLSFHVIVSLYHWCYNSIFVSRAYYFVCEDKGLFTQVITKVCLLAFGRISISTPGGSAYSDGWRGPSVCACTVYETLQNVSVFRFHSLLGMVDQQSCSEKV